MSWTKAFSVFICFCLFYSIAVAEQPNESTVKQWATNLGEAFKAIANNQLGVQHLKDTYSDLWDNGKYRTLDQDGPTIISKLSTELKKLVEEKEQVVRKLETKLSETLNSYVREGDNPQYIDSSDPNDVQSLNLEDHPNFPQKVDTRQSVVKFAPEADKEDEAVKDMLFISQELESIFEENVDKTTWQYFGSSEGFFRRYPGSEWDKDDNGNYLPFDPRLRAWYVGASSGPKDIILLIDVSGSMGTNNRIDIARESALTVLETLTIRDYVNVILFNSNAIVSSCFPDKLVRATPENIDKLRSFIMRTAHSGGTNFKAPFTEAFNMFEKSYEQNIGSRCESVILFMTDGEASDPSEIIDARQTSDLSVTIFSYALGADADVDIPRDIACKNNGLFFAIGDPDDLRSQMGAYYTYFALGIDTERTLWTAPYFDVNGLGLILTVSLPVYDRRQSPARLVGVVGTDIVVNELVSQAFSAQSQDSYGFVVNTEGQVLTHPRLQPPASYTEPPVYVDISSLETDPAFESVRESMMALESGDKSATIERQLPRGDVSFEGVRTKELPVTYYWEPIPGAQFSVGFVLATSDESTIRWRSPDEFGTSYYHRIDLYPGTDAPPIDVTADGNFYRTYNASTFKVASKGFSDPFNYERKTETKSMVQDYNEYMNDKTGNVLNPGFVDDLRPTVQLSVDTADLKWKDGYDDSKQLFLYYGTDNGMWRAYPGHNGPKLYDPTRRPWYLRALSSQDTITVSTPYEDATFAAIDQSIYVVTISQTIEEPRDDGKVLGVAGIDFLYDSFVDLLGEHAPGCANDPTLDCVLVDSSGLLITHKKFRSTPQTNKFMGNSEYELNDLTQYLLEEDLLVKDTFNNFAQLQKIKYYKMSDQFAIGGVEYRQVSLADCFDGAYQITPVPGSNLFLVVIFDQTQLKTSCESIKPETSPIDICTTEVSGISEAKCLNFELTPSMLSNLRGGTCDGSGPGSSSDSNSVSIAPHTVPNAFWLTVLSGAILICTLVKVQF